MNRIMVVLAMCLITGFIAPALIPDTSTGDTILLVFQVPTFLALVIFVVWPVIREETSRKTRAMNRPPLWTLLILGVIAAVVSLALGAITGTGEVGAQIFMFICSIPILIYMLWPEVRAQKQASRSPNGSRQ